MRLFPELATCHDVSIPELLASRDERQARQRAWLTRHATPLVSFTVVAPGPMKRDTENAKTGQRKYEKTIFRILCVKPPISGGFLSMFKTLPKPFESSLQSIS